MTTYKKETQPIALIILLATTFLPVTNSFNLLKTAIVFVLCLYNKGNQDSFSVWPIGKRIVTVWLICIVLASLSVVAVEGSVNQGIIVHEFSRLIYYSLVIYLCSTIHVNLKFLFICCAFVLSIHSIIQITQYLRLGTFNHYIETYYLAGNSENIHYQLATKSYYTFRSGSIFINPNVYVCYPYLSMAVFLEYYNRTKSWLPLVFTILAFVSVVLTGSRMGLGSFIIIIGWYFVYGRTLNEDTVYSRQRYAAPLVMALIIILLVFNWGTLTSSTDDLRAFNLTEAYSGSGASKLEGFIYYLTHANPLYWITGSLGSNSLNVQIDMEYGYIFAWFGVIGIIWYVKLLKTVYYNNYDFRILSTISVMAIMLTAFGATSVLNMSVFPYICAISLTSIIHHSGSF